MQIINNEDGWYCIEFVWHEFGIIEHLENWWQENCSDEVIFRPDSNFAKHLLKFRSEDDRILFILRWSGTSIPYIDTEEELLNAMAAEITVEIDKNIIEQLKPAD